MPCIARRWCALAMIVALTSTAAAQDAVDADVLLAGGIIVDGSGAEGTVGDVALKDGKIVAVGKFTRGAIGQVLDCQGMVVAPGFIDLHSHSDRGITDPKT